MSAEPPRAPGATPPACATCGHSHLRNGQIVNPCPAHPSLDCPCQQYRPASASRGETPPRDAPSELVDRILNGLDAASNRFHDLGEQAEEDREVMASRYEELKRQGLDFTSAGRQARREFIAAALSASQRAREESRDDA
jgi:hypothetical protein